MTVGLGWTWVGLGLDLGWTWVGLGLDLGWTINRYNKLSHSILSIIGLDYDKNCRINYIKLIEKG